MQPSKSSADKSFARVALFAQLLLAAFIIIYGVNCVRRGWWDPPRTNASATVQPQHKLGTDSTEYPQTLSPLVNVEQPRRKIGTDFTAYYSAGELARQGQDIYDWKSSSTPRRPFIYPPMFAVFPMAPLSLLPHNAALAVFYLLNVAMLLGALWLLRLLLWREETFLSTQRHRDTETQRKLAPDFASACLRVFAAKERSHGSAATPKSVWRRPAVGLFLAVVVCWRFIHSNMVLGNANVIILFLLVLALYLLPPQPQPPPRWRGGGRGRSFWAGVTVALATAFKVTPGLFGLYLLWSWRRWALVGGALGLVFFLLLVPAALLGFTHNWTELTAFVAHAKSQVLQSKEDSPTTDAAPAVGWGKRGEDESEGTRAVGVSLRGTLLKVLSPTIALNRQPEKDGRSVNLVDLEFAQAKAVADAVSLLLLLVTVALTLPAWTRATTAASSLSWSMVAVTMVLISPLTRTAHLTVLLLPCVVLIALLQQDQLAALARRLAWISLLVLGLGGILASDAVIGSRAGQTVHALGLATWSALLLYAALAVALWGQRNVIPVVDSSLPSSYKSPAASGCPP